MSIEPNSSTVAAACCGGAVKPSSDSRIVPSTPDSSAVLRALMATKSGVLFISVAVVSAITSP